MKNLTVVKSNKVIEAGYKLTLMEQLLLLSCIAQIDSRSVLTPEKRFEISVESLLQIKLSETKNEYRDLKKAAERLLNRIVTINNPYADERRVTQLKTHWISYVAYIPEEGKIRLGFSLEIIPYLSQLSKAFTCYKLQHVGKMSSVYAIRLYELLMQWKNVGKREVEIEWLKTQFQLEGKYSSIKNLKMRVIEPAVKDINTHSNYSIEWTQRKTGRRVTHLTFIFDEKVPKKSPKPFIKEVCIHGVPKSKVKALARKGESWEQAAERINSEELAAKF